jgi:A/G-specific adenine glycosylase
MLMLCNPDGAVLLEHRPPSGRWGGLWSLPEFDDQDQTMAWISTRFGAIPVRSETWPVLRHSFTHFHLDIQPLYVALDKVPETVMEGESWVWYRGDEQPGGLAAPVTRILEGLFDTSPLQLLGCRESH